MYVKKDRKKEMGYDWSGSCAPARLGAYTNWVTFSVGIFKWVAKSSGKGLKRSAVVYRIKVCTKDEERIYSRAEYVCDEMDMGIFPTKKSETI